MEACRTALIRIAAYSYLMTPRRGLNLAPQTAGTHANRIRPNSGDLGLTRASSRCSERPLGVHLIPCVTEMYPYFG